MIKKAECPSCGWEVAKASVRDVVAEVKRQGGKAYETMCDFFGEEDVTGFG